MVGGFTERDQPPELTMMGQVVSEIGSWSRGVEDVVSQTSPRLMPGGSEMSSAPNEATTGLATT